MRARVLIVDDEEDLVWTLVRQIPRERPDFTVEGFSDSTEALERLRTDPPDVLVTDLRMPKIGGIDLMIAARQVAPRLPVIVMTAFNTAHVRKEVMKQGGVAFLEKPFELPAILEALDRAIGSKGGFQGAVSLAMLPDLVQLYALGRVTGALRISNGERAGVLWFEAGEVVHAVCDQKKGAEAFYDLIQWEGGLFRMDVEARVPERTIEASWQSLLLEGCRLMDEQRRERDPFPLASSPPPAVDKTLLEDGGEPWAAPVFDRRRSGEPLDLASAGAALTLALPGAWPAEPAPERAAAAWSETLDELARLAAPFSNAGGAGLLELVSPDGGFALIWDGAGSRAGFGTDLAGREAAVRFRAATAGALRMYRCTGETP